MNKENIVHVVLTGGGTGGHLYPLIAIAEELQKSSKPTKVTYIGPNREYDELFKKMGVQAFHIPSSKLRRYADLENVLDIFRFFVSLIKSIVLLYFIMPDVLFIKGGPGSLAVGLAAKFYFIKTLVHESDALPSLTTRVLSGMGAKILCSFEQTSEYFGAKNTLLVGNPVRTHLLTDTIPDKVALKQSYGFNSANPVMLVMGGSQGAKKINDFIIDNIKAITEVTQILHQTGKDNLKQVELELSELLKNPQWRQKYQVRGYLENGHLRDAMNMADIIVTRAGASTLFEIALIGVPAIVVPIAKSANNHQRKNAIAYENTGAGIALEESNLTIHVFLSQLKKVLENKEQRESMIQATKKIRQPGAAKNIAELIVNNNLAIH